MSDLDGKLIERLLVVALTLSIVDAAVILLHLLRVLPG